MWRPRAGLVTLHSGGPGTRPGGTTTPPRGARWTGRLGDSRQTPPRPGVEPARGAEAGDERGVSWKRGPGIRNRHHGAPRGAAPSQEGANSRKVAPIGAPSPRLCEGQRSPPRRERKTGVPGAATKNTGDGARLHHIRSFPRKRESSALLKNWAPASAGASGRVGAFSSLPLRGGRLRAMTAVQIHCNHASAKARG